MVLEVGSPYIMKVRVFIWLAVMQVIVNHVSEDICTEESQQHGYVQTVWQQTSEQHEQNCKQSDGQTWREDSS